jgi:hypothetical protein
VGFLEEKDIVLCGASFWIVIVGTDAIANVALFNEMAFHPTRQILLNAQRFTSLPDIVNRKNRGGFKNTICIIKCSMAQSKS